ncbi:WxL domain-containing protein [Vagococcus silagei]|uniref:WxL domain-containing protein n=1 Tax=Vagococcus silagei TaxID=2508885 RepID=A0A4S3B5D6_9ENTE|nr:WxL domain-containing protein [Vagococcus silagei]THB62331.1 WxL domain-containing protein [Vagococcus silagei]
MKKVLLLSTITLGAFVFTTQSANAAPITSAKTIGDVTFTTGGDEDNEGGKPELPGEPGGKVNPDGDGSFSNGTLRLEWISNFHFGSQKISSADQDYASIWNPMKIRGQEEMTYYTPFVQVTDETGNPNQTWELKVSMADDDKFKEENGTGILANTYIELYDVQRTNRVYHGDAFKNIIQEAAAETFETPKRIDKNGVVLAKTKVPGATNGTKTSVAFASPADFDRTTSDMVGIKEENGKNNAVKLHSPSSDVKVATKKYTATLTWELNNVQ